MNPRTPVENTVVKGWMPGLLQILWPGFFSAAILTGMLFSVVDPLSVELVQNKLNNSREAAYTIAFVIIWMVTSSACATTRLLSAGQRR